MLFLFPSLHTPTIWVSFNSSLGDHRIHELWLRGHIWPVDMFSLAFTVFWNALISYQHLQIGKFHIKIRIWGGPWKIWTPRKLRRIFWTVAWARKGRYIVGLKPTLVGQRPQHCHCFLPGLFTHSLTRLASVGIWVCEVWSNQRQKVCRGRSCFLISFQPPPVILIRRKGANENREGLWLSPIWEPFGFSSM